jgi:DNA-binding transcriptional LysR family regulator
VELRHLRCFVSIAEQGQVSAAAQALHVAQPALSQTLRQLERELGVPLFERHPRGLCLTEAGQQLMPYAKAAVDNSDSAVEAVRAYVRGQQRAIRVGFLPPLTSFATSVVAAYERDQPGMTVTVHELRFADFMAAVAKQQVDVALVWAGMPEPGVTLEPLVDEPRAVCLSASHPLASRRDVRFAEVEHEPLIRMSDDFPSGMSDFLHLSSLRRGPPVLGDRVPRSWEEGVWMIASGRVICTGPLSLAEALARPGIVVVPLSDVPPVTIAVARHANDRRASVHAFARCAVSAVQPRRVPADSAGGRRRSS